MDTIKNVPQEGAYIQVVWYIRGEHVLVTEKFLDSYNVCIQTCQQKWGGWQEDDQSEKL